MSHPSHSLAIDGARSATPFERLFTTRVLPAVARRSAHSCRSRIRLVFRLCDEGVSNWTVVNVSDRHLPTFVSCGWGVAR